MLVADELIERNAKFAAKRNGDLPELVPSLRTIVIACCDHRADPAHVLGLELGEAVVIRNAGGRINPDVVRTLQTLATVAALEQVSVDVEVIVMQHTDCGTSRLASPAFAQFAAELLDTDPDQIASKHLDDPFEAVRGDVDLIREHPLFPGTIPVTGLVYDTTTGKVEVACRLEPAV